MDDQTEIASGFTIGTYRKIRQNLDVSTSDTSDWQTVLDAFNRRIRERFLRPIRELAKHDKKSLQQKHMMDNNGLPYHPGAAILALDCLLIDTIQSFREGRGTTNAASPAHSFKDFLKGSERFADFASKDREDFFGSVRNGLLHDGEIRGNWKVRIDTSVLLKKNGLPKTRVINRRIFHARVVREFRELYWGLKSATQGAIEARERFLHRMDAICGMISADLPPPSPNPLPLKGGED